MPAPAIDYAAELNPEQLAVVTGGDGPCVVLAGAGSGKTRTIVYRVAWLIEHGVRPEQILLLTFTNKAASGMMERIQQLIGNGPLDPSTPRPPIAVGGRPHEHSVYGGTFHSVANRLLRAFADQIGFSPSFSILDEEDARDLMRSAMRELELPLDGKRFPSPAVIHATASFARNAILPLEEAVLRKHPRFEPLLDDFRRTLERYEEKKRLANAMDFDDLLVRFHALLVSDPSARERIVSRFRYVLVDEYQDTNPLQAAIVALLAGPERNVLVVGDDAQSIYSFRAADVRNILQFPDRFPGARIFKIETNYRSTPDILSLANDVISRNVEQFRKELKSVSRSLAKPVVAPAASAGQEAAFVAGQIQRLLDDGTAPKEIAVLFRATHHSQALEFALMRRGLEYDYRGGLRFFDRAHVKDALAFLRVCANPADEAAWLRILRLQPGIGEIGAAKAAGILRRSESIGRAALAPVGAELGLKAGKGWDELRAILEALVAAGDAPTAQIRAVLDSSYSVYLENEYPDSRERFEDLEQLAGFAGGYAKAAEMLADVALDITSAGGTRGRASATPRIVLSTVHQAKGLEWDTVFVIHLAGSAFPNRRAAIEEGGLEEERRLFYVAITRAKRRLFLCYPATLGRDQFTQEQPSCFLKECDPSCLDLSLVEKSGASWSDADGDFYEEESVTVDDGPIAAVKERMKNVNADWKKKSFLRDV